jgi:hypothetical protein
MTKIDAAEIQALIFARMQRVEVTLIEQVYRTRVGLTNLYSARQNKIEASFACGPTEEDHSPVGKADEEDQFWKVAASPNSSNLTACGINWMQQVRE